jgi:hypothetical protein
MPEQPESGPAATAETEAGKAEPAEGTPLAPAAEPKYPIEITATRAQLEALRAKLRRRFH